MSDSAAATPLALVEATGFKAPNAVKRLGVRLGVLTVDQWFDSFADHPQDRAESKNGLEAWSPATFRGDKREGAALEQIWAVGFDVDVDPVPTLDTIEAACSTLRGLVYASWSHKVATERNAKASERWRLLLALSRPVTTTDEYHRIWSSVASGFPFKVGQEAKDAARAWYLPCATADGSLQVARLRGAPIDVDAILARTETQSVSRPTNAPSLTLPRATDDERRRSAAANLLGLSWPPVDSHNRHQAQNALAGALARDGWLEPDALDIVCDVCRIAGDEDREKRTNTIRDAFSKWRAKGEESRITGWTSLEKYVTPTIVNAARDLLKPYERPWNFAERAVAQNDSHTEEVDALTRFVDSARLSDADAKLEFLVDEILPVGSVSAFVAQPYALKTFAAYSLAVAVSKGLPWLGKYATRKGSVLMLDFEMGGRRMKKRLRALGGDDSITRVHHPESMLTEKTFEALIKRKPALVIVDSLSGGNRADNENDPTFAMPLDFAKRVSDACDTSFIFIHHEVKDTNGKAKQKRIRGTGAILGALDVCYSLDVCNAGNEKRSEVECIKMRDGEEPRKFTIKLTHDLRIELHEDGAQPGSPRSLVRGANLEESVKNAIQMYGPLTQADLAEKLARRNLDVRTVCNLLSERGELVRINRKLELDDDQHRNARIRKLIDEAKALRIDPSAIASDKKLAQAAHVDTEYVRGLLLTGTLARTSSEDGAEWIWDVQRMARGASS